MTVMLGLSIALCATPRAAQPANNAAMQVSLTIRESCLIQTLDGAAGNVTRPHVACLHNAPHMVRLMEEPSGMPGATTPTARSTTSTTWLIKF